MYTYPKFMNQTPDAARRAEALFAGALTVEREPLYTSGGRGVGLDMLVANDQYTGEAYDMGAVSPAYKLVQPADFVRDVWETATASYSGAGKVGAFVSPNYQNVYFFADEGARREVTTRKGDALGAALMVQFPLVAGASVKVSSYIWRLVCINGMVRSEPAGVFNLQHRYEALLPRIDSAMYEADQLIGGLVNKMSQLEAISYSRSQFMAEMVAEVVPMPERPDSSDNRVLAAYDKRAVKAEQQRGLLARSWDDSPGIDDISPSAYRAVNALSYYVENYTRTRGDSIPESMIAGKRQQQISYWVNRFSQS